MKKFYAPIIFTMLFAFGFSQAYSQVIAPRVAYKSTVLGAKTPNQISNTKEASTNWYSYVDFLSVYNDPENPLEYSGIIMQCDTTGLVYFSNDTVAPQFLGMGQLFTFTDPIWDDFLNAAWEYTGTPYASLGTGTNFTIDSIRVWGGYSRGVNVPADVVDTLIFSIVTGYTDLYVGGLTSGGADYCNMPYIGYDLINSVTTDVSGDTPSGATVEVIRYPLTVSDSSSYWQSFTIPVNITNPAASPMFIGYTFKPGMTRTLTDVIGEDIDEFIAMVYDDPRVEYSTTGSPELMNEANNSMCIINWSFDNTSDLWYSRWAPNSIWQGDLMRPDIAALITCNDCSMTSVEEMESKNISIYPNPATENFVVNLADNSNAQIQLFNLVGQVVVEQNVNAQTATINVSNLNDGIYMLKVMQNGQVYTSKVVVR